ncbi:pseudouridine synthase [Mycoplasma phocimorsus]|uniref:Pseudouridine synthase n=1 Tax=Mycoplasma phocimorsus TaxID=3045839 RepID=A0AAJ1UVY3_9MOLU|nr:pseudouridine synthase [Mycoplasma phocimorsus]MDJ1646019.1 pseudouridine synthase [Mycoplasma phocimorsus]MDJ1646300.1 pseudouridine synthase [Mycoplasma phocimorsus]MDJ1646905.1 pseudouridine synthase [Mycoplasma phocimorsus]MDJ1647872.1 pseudouridine synthase [Mycoplasma phocimorsus]MDJ1648428.1 pseudouridine synthase [Mycoplasma phocimorsus]
MKNECNIRIQKLIAQSGICSRRKAEKLIEQNKVKINDKVAKLGDKCNENDIILIDNKQINIEKKEYYLLNKPKGYVCSSNDKHHQNLVVDLIPSSKRIYTVGRLDKDTTGAIIITNDGNLTHLLSHPSFKIEREYNVEIDKPLSAIELKEINKNFFINEKMSYHKITHLIDKFYKITLHQGSYHHVKLIFEKFNKKVINLHRRSYSFLNVDKMNIGEYRIIKPFEIKKLKYSRYN